MAVRALVLLAVALASAQVVLAQCSCGSSLGGYGDSTPSYGGGSGFDQSSANTGIPCGDSSNSNTGSSYGSGSGFDQSGANTGISSDDSAGSSFGGSSYEGPSYGSGSGLDQSGALSGGPSSSGGSSIIGYRAGCCPGDVIEKDVVVNRPRQVPYTYIDTVTNKKCYQANDVDRKVTTRTFQTQPKCKTETTVTTTPLVETTVEETPLCKSTCTHSEYILQVPIRQIICHKTPYCKKRVVNQQKTQTTVSKKLHCTRQQCTQDHVTETPTTKTVCTNYENKVPRTGTKTVIRPVVEKQCVQLPPRRCLKPVYGNAGQGSSGSSSGDLGGFGGNNEGSGFGGNSGDSGFGSAQGSFGSSGSSQCNTGAGASLGGYTGGYSQPSYNQQSSGSSDCSC